MASSSESYLPSSSLRACDKKLAPIRAGTCLLQRPKSTLWHLGLQLAYSYFKGNWGTLIFCNSIDLALVSSQYFLLTLCPCCDEPGSKRALIDGPNPNRWPEVTCRELPSPHVKHVGLLAVARGRAYCQVTQAASKSTTKGSSAFLLSLALILSSTLHLFQMDVLSLVVAGFDLGSTL